ncbi:hypothetical protein CcaverHIS631_0701660 [Cutaneotrichosporon cavernicola]|nr:hypothetical protein CcaverHIS631_0701660 [Cutaneotrichosporon cavernicola]BEJ10128.1 hypothetical protein CcaverHIS641_0701630 [Cutaneotrichosporon cavernicola]
MPPRKRHSKKHNDGDKVDTDKGKGKDEGSGVPRILVPDETSSSGPPSGDTSAASSTLHTPMGTPFPVTGEGQPQSRNLRQRFAEMTRDIGKAGEELSVRIRRKADGNFKVVAPGTPYDEIELHDIDHPSHKKHHAGHQEKQAGWKKWFVGRRVLFPLAFLLGMAAVWTATQPDLLGGEMTDLWPMLQSDMSNFLGNMSMLDSAKKAIFETRDFTVGDSLHQELGLAAKHPVIMMPGVVTSGLESWSTDPIARSWFRLRLWGTSTMIRAVLTDKERWVEAMAIDLETGLDPPGHRVRAAQGLDAASEFIQGYWVWQKVVQNLATIGYDPSNMDLAAYDWRVAFYNLEVRDAYLSRLKDRIELMHKLSGEKVVLVSHSMGGSLMLYFLKWVEAKPDALGFGGGGGPRWVEDHLEAWVNVAGTLLGVPKAMTAFMSGEMRDTVEINPLGSYVLEKFFCRKERADLFRRWPGASSMYMKGGERIWGDLDGAPDDPANATDTYGRFFSFRETASTSEKDMNRSTIYPNLTAEETVPYILEHTSDTYQRMFESNYSVGFETDPRQLRKNAKDHSKWSNPLEVELPQAPSMKIYCLYGHGKETERAYWYVKGEYEEGEGRDAPDSQCDVGDSGCERTPGDFPLARNHRIDNDVTVKGTRPEVRSGVKFSDGDGTIATASLGAMCVRGWKGKTKWNPAGVKVVTREALDLRGGALTSDHVDILGSSPLNEAILKIVGGRGDLVKPHIGSDIERYVEKMKWD